MKGQFLIRGILAVFFSIILYLFGVFPVISPMIDTFITDNPDLNALDRIILQMIPFFILIAIVFSIISFIAPLQP